MPLFEITQPLTATLIVECASEEEAADWADKIVVGIEDENGNAIESDKIIVFEAERIVSEIRIEKLPDNEFVPE